MAGPEAKEPRTPSKPAPEPGREGQPKTAPEPGRERRAGGGRRRSTGPGAGDAEHSGQRFRQRPVERLALPEPPPVRSGVLLELMAGGELEILGRLAGSSNNALLAVVREAGHHLEAPVVYKPIAGERPLWDFPDGTLAHREMAAYLLAEAAGWSIVPPTVFRDGPFGPGMVQLWVEADPRIDRVALVVEADPRLRPIALFDVAANNADRKVGHLIPTRAGQILGVDHGICFHVEPKLRTVLWAWRGERLTIEEQDRLANLRDRLHGPLADELGRHLARVEILALRRRIEGLLRFPCFPDPDPDRPAIPWPPY